LNGTALNCVAQREDNLVRSATVTNGGHPSLKGRLGIARSTQQDELLAFFWVKFGPFGRVEYKMQMCVNETG
jgi:hypothetical protein